MLLTADGTQILFKGRTLTPGDTFEPFPVNRPGYLVTFDGVINGRVYVSDRDQTISTPLAEVPDADPGRARDYTGPFADDTAHTTLHITTEG
jgi:hypothetical protein